MIRNLQDVTEQCLSVVKVSQGREGRDRTDDSLGITAPENRLKMRPEIIMVDLVVNDLSGIEGRTPEKRKAHSEQAMLEDMIGPRKITILEIGYVADIRYEDKYKVKISYTDLSARSLIRKGMR